MKRNQALISKLTQVVGKSITFDALGRATVLVEDDQRKFSKTNEQGAKSDCNEDSGHPCTDDILTKGDISWIPELGLKVQDKRNIESGWWLNVRIINAVMMLIKKITKDRKNGLYDVIQAPTLAMFVTPVAPNLFR